MCVMRCSAIFRLAIRRPSPGSPNALRSMAYTCRQSPDGFRFWRWFSHRGSVNFLNSPLVSKELAARARTTGAALSALLLAVAGPPTLILTLRRHAAAGDLRRDRGAEIQI